MKDVSIIIPIYNCEKYLEECLESVVNQTYPKNKIEVIMVNDGTQDNSALICEKYSKEYDWKFINRLINKGLSHTRNEGIENSTSKYIVFLDSDDLLYIDAIERLMKNIVSSDSDIVVSKLNSFNSKGEYGYYSDKYLRKNLVTNINKNKKILNCISVCGKIYKRELIKDIRFLSGKKHEDNYFTLMVYKKANKIKILSEYTYYRRIREGDDKSIMQSLDINSFSDLTYNFKAFVDTINCERENIFYYYFIIKKLINYAVMNLDKKNRNIAFSQTQKLMIYFMSESKIKKLNYIIFFIFFHIYCMLARVYKEISNV